MNDNIETKSYMDMFADDSEVRRIIIMNVYSSLERQNYVTIFCECNYYQQMEFIVEKRHAFKFGNIGNGPDWDYKIEAKRPH